MCHYICQTWREFQTSPSWNLLMITISSEITGILLTFKVSFCKSIPSLLVRSPWSLVEMSEAKSHVTVGMGIGRGWDSIVAICLSPSLGEVLLFLSTETATGVSLVLKQYKNISLRIQSDAAIRVRLLFSFVRRKSQGRNGIEYAHWNFFPEYLYWKRSLRTVWNRGTMNNYFWKYTDTCFRKSKKLVEFSPLKSIFENTLLGKDSELNNNIFYDKKNKILNYWMMI